MWTTIALATMFLIGVATGTALTWWRWRAALEILDRSTEWRTLGAETKTQIETQRRYLRKLDETVGRLAEFVRIQIRVTTPEHLRSTVAKMVGERAPEKPEAGWEAPIPPFEEGVARAEKRVIPRGR